MEKRATTLRTRNARLKAETFNAYGNACACCGESEKKFLTLDHINGDGAAHRKTLKGGGTAIYDWAKKHHFPPTIQILCANCHFAKTFYGNCPHQQSDLNDH